MKTAIASTLRNALTACALGAAAFTTVVPATPIWAQAGMTNVPDLSAIRFSGVWSVSGHRLRISTNYRHNIARGYLLDKTEKPLATFELAPMQDGKSLQGTMKHAEPTSGGRPSSRTVRLTLVRPGVAELHEVTALGTLGDMIWRAFSDGDIVPNSNRLRDFVGTWDTSLGLLDFKVEMDHLYGEVRRKRTDGKAEAAMLMAADIPGQPMSSDSSWSPMYRGFTGAWADPADPKRGGLLLLKLTQDKSGFEGEYHASGKVTKITAKRYDPLDRYGDQPAPSQPTPPVVTPPAQTPPVVSPPGPQPGPVVTPPTPSDPVVTGGFKPLRRVDVRLDRIVVARGYPTHQVHAFVTVRNASPGLQYFTSGFLKVLLTDADGVSLERSQPYRASGEPAALFMSTPVIQPGGELKVRYVFTPPEDAQLTSLTFSEGDQRAEFPVSGLGAANNESIP